MASPRVTGEGAADPRSDRALIGKEQPMHRASRRWSWLAVLVVWALVLPAATGARAQEGEKILRVHHLSYPDVVDPQKSSFTAEIDILQLVYEGLTRLDASQQTIPGAAESWAYNDDATGITFTLRQGL